MEQRANPSDVIRLDLPSVDAVLEGIGCSTVGPTRSVAEWREEIEEVRREAFAAGVEHARANLDRELKAELERSQRDNELLDSAIRGLHIARAQQFSLELADVIRFSIELAERILQAELVPPVDRIAQIVDETAQSAATQESFLIRVAADNLEDVAARVIPKLRERGLDAQAVVGEGFGDYDLMIEAGARVFDARISTAFARVVNELGAWHHDS